jgi:hypothetical protein
VQPHVTRMAADAFANVLPGDVKDLHVRES